MPFDAYDASLELIRRLAALHEQIATRDPSLAKQLRDAASSVPLNLREGRKRAGRDRLHHYRIASGSADEVVACLEVAAAWGYVTRPATTDALAVADRLLAMTWGLTH